MASTNFDKPLDKTVASLSDAIANIGIKKITKVTGTTTTGATGNIALPVGANGKKFVVGAHSTSGDYYIRAWVAQTSVSWFLTVINPNTGAAVTNTSVSYAFWEVEMN